MDKDLPRVHPHGFSVCYRRSRHLAKRVVRGKIHRCDDVNTQGNNDVRWADEVGPDEYRKSDKQG